MKNFIRFISLIAVIMLTASTSFAQSGDIKVGGGLVYGSEVEAIGLQANGVYGFTEEISAAADVSIYFPDGYDWWAINLNGHYNFHAEEGTSVYGLAGLNIATLSFDVDLGQFGSASGSDSEVGLNLGGGAEFDVEFAHVFGEAKYIIGNADQFVIGAGLRFAI